MFKYLEVDLENTKQKVSYDEHRISDLDAKCARQQEMTDKLAEINLQFKRISYKFEDISDNIVSND